MKEKLTIEQKLAKREYKIPGNLIWAAYSFLVAMPFFEPKYHATYDIIDDPRKEKGPCFIVWNHLSRRDYLFIKKVFGWKKFNMVAGASEFYRKKFYGLFSACKIIPKKNFTNDPVGIRAINKVIKSGGCISFSPEGMSSIYGHNQPVVPGTGRFLQFYRIPVYFMKLEGAYLTSHKTDIKDRPGKVHVTVSKLFTSEDLKSMTPEQIEDKLNLTFKHDDYEWNKTARVKYKIKNRAAYNLETICYKCPKCGKDLVMVGEGNKLYCKECGNGVEIDEYYDFHYLHEGDVAPVSPSAWFDWQREQVIKEIRADENYSFTCDVEIGEMPKYKPIKDKNSLSLPCGKGKITIDHKGMHFEGERHGEPWSWTLGYDVIYSLVIENDTTATCMYVKGECIEIKPTTPCVGKMLLLVEEMHRLHVNLWKNFPWCDYMYNGTELEKK
ncbi:MAG: 1-acyl-sn-glycerol-3-phosphate acyltransferase [Bacilli bacterium]|nr:1-acyl-sn-glycerol-3-phosphate acyltransferase [Bacilli bacterium]